MGNPIRRTKPKTRTGVRLKSGNTRVCDLSQLLLLREKSLDQTDFEGNILLESFRHLKKGSLIRGALGDDSETRQIRPKSCLRQRSICDD